MSINWNLTVTALDGSIVIPTYGNYGGPNYSDGSIVPPGQIAPLTTPPVDALDALFRLHDQAYYSTNDPTALAQADLALLRGIAALSDAQLSPEGHLYAGVTELVFVARIESRWQRPDLFAAGEKQLLTNDGLDNLRQGGIDPSFNEIAAVFGGLYNNLIGYASSALPAAGETDALVDDVYYLIQNPDVFAAGIDPDQHYAAAGWREGRNPNAFFSTAGYLSANEDVENANINPLQHFAASGWREGRDPSTNFDTGLYLRHNPDVAAAGINPLTHYLQSGLAEGRMTFPAVGSTILNGFDASYYLLANPDVGRADVDAAFHFQSSGWREGRDPNAWFDTSAYLAAYGDVAAAGVNPLAHYDALGWKEGRDPSPAFDTSSYLAAYPDVAAANIDPLQHFLVSGIHEGRSAFGDGLIG